MKKSKRASLTTQYIILFGVLFLLTDIVLGFVLHWQSSSMVQALIEKSMLNISNTAAELVDGDVIGAFTKEDVGSEAYNIIYKDLTAFQNNADIKFIYAVRQEGEEKYTFTVDPDPVDPGEFGEEIVVTEAVRQAGKGIAAVDDAPARDRWGNFYSAYSPIFDSKGNVAGIIGIDFTSAWYQQQIWKNTFYVIVISVLFTLAGACGFILLSVRVRRRFADLNEELLTLSGDVETLTQEIMSSSGYVTENSGIQGLDETGISELDEGDEILTLGHKIRAMHEEMERYINYMDAQVNTDALTRVGNTTAYLERQRALKTAIIEGTADFSLVLFDINDLKYINDHFGHAGGDSTICAAAAVVAENFDRANTFRIGGDEFIAIVDRMPEDELVRCLEGIDISIASYNRSRPEGEAALSLSKGEAVYHPGHDHSFHDVFIRADKKMYERKDSYHRRNNP